MRIRHMLLLSFLLVGLLSGCKGNMNNYGTDGMNNDRMDERIGTNINERDVNRREYNTTRVRFNDANEGRNVTDVPMNDQRTMRSDGTREHTRQRNVTNDDRFSNNVLNTGDTTETNMRVADKIADHVTQLKEVDAATVIVTQHNAYVAAKLDDSSRDEFTRDIERKITERVKSADRQIDNVYVSVNPDFFERSNRYAEDIRQGRPVSGFLDEFTETIQRMFPHNTTR